jgi:hypothetical protein
LIARPRFIADELFCFFFQVRARSNSSIQTLVPIYLYHQNSKCENYYIHRTRADEWRNVYCRSSLHPLKFNSTHPHCKDTSLCDAKWLLIIMLVLILHRIMKAAAAAVTRFATAPTSHSEYIHCRRLCFVCEKGASCICIVRV